MSKHEHQNEANFSFMQSMVQSESAAPIPGQLNFMQETSQNQFSLVPMRPPNDGNQVASYLLNLDKGSSKGESWLFRQNSDCKKISSLLLVLFLLFLRALKLVVVAFL
ncbi:hypothetical protein JHK87_024429 [Glycine soja]|nr:hypothetical protein JHK87_024429 [Glycine soja]